MTHEIATIRSLNDRLRQNLQTGIAVITPGIAALGQEAVQRIIKTIAVYDDFCHEQKVFFKIDYYDKHLNVHSPDPSDPLVTERVITIMLAEEY